MLEQVTVKKDDIIYSINNIEQQLKKLLELKKYAVDAVNNNDLEAAHEYVKDFYYNSALLGLSTKSERLMNFVQLQGIVVNIEKQEEDDLIFWVRQPATEAVIRVKMLLPLIINGALQEGQSVLVRGNLIADEHTVAIEGFYAKILENNKNS